MFSLNCNGRLIVVDKPLVMGILNITPDSFYEGSRVMTNEDLLRKAEKMLEDGASILDIGAQSTRPGSERISAEEEIRRLIPAIESVAKNFPESIISADTYQSKVAVEAVGAGAGIINDISSGDMDHEMLSVVASLKVAYISMHMKGSPDTMQRQAQYDNVCTEILDYFIKKTAECKAAGIKDIIIDPGFGFAKTPSHNFQLLKNLSIFKMLQLPVLIGLSRKSTIYKTLNITAAEALNGTTVLNTIGLMQGASILRVHDVKESVEAVKLFVAMENV